MSIFDIFRRKIGGRVESNVPELEFGNRGEDVIYRLPGKEIYVVSTWLEGRRVYTEDIDKWQDGSPLSEEEEKKIFSDVLHFLGRKGEPPLVVINTDDPLKDLWEQMCSLNQSLIKGIEYTSDEVHFQNEREMWLGLIKAGQTVTLEGVEVRTENELDEVMQKQRKRRAV